MQATVPSMLTALLGQDGGLVQCRIFSFLDIPRYRRGRAACAPFAAGRRGRKILMLCVSPIPRPRRLSLVRLSQVSSDLSVAASDDGLWREVLQHQFDVVRPQGSQKELVKRLHQGITEGWEGLCLDRHTAHWTPQPFMIEVSSASRWHGSVFARTKQVDASRLTGHRAGGRWRCSGTTPGVAVGDSDAAAPEPAARCCCSARRLVQER